MAGLLDTIAKRLRQVAFSFREKPQTKVDDYVLEHFLFYHGLVGSSPENQRSLRDVKQDISDALDNGSSLQLGIALKVQPLWWEDKLRTIFDELPNKSKAAELLIPELEDPSWPNHSDPLGHPEWIVRANAANIITHLKIQRADERMSRALNDTVDNGTAAFCHIAYALGRISTEKARDTLSALISAEEPWFRVDVAGALAASSREDIYELLAEALFSDHPLQDYTAVAIARHRTPLQLLNSSSKTVQDGGCALIIGLLQASKQTFNADLVDDSDLDQWLPLVNELAQQDPNPIRIRANILLAESLDANQEHSKSAKEENESEIIRKYKSPEYTSLILKWLNPTATQNAAWAACNQRHAIHLIGQLKIQSALPELLNMLDKNAGPTDAIIESIEQLGDISATKQLVAMVGKLVNLDDRVNRLPSKQPVLEDNAAETKTYWQILKALGNLPAPNSMTLLTTATNDFAPDKREQALSSLISAYEKNSSLMSKTAVQDVLKKALSDPSTGIRVVALDGVGRLNKGELLEQVLDAFDAREISVSKQAKSTLSKLWAAGKSTDIEKEIQTRLKKEHDEFKRKKMEEFLASEKSN
ncbi:MAG: HEAT repeat domain-containing protein [Candidatus Melainabacteria bacterium]|nr:MAG: HEAT repeat domain-containing protein [Candidatus Melainabacteria bacterium]